MSIEAILGAILGLGFIAVGVMQVADPKRFLGSKAPWWMTSRRLRDPLALRINGVLLIAIGAVLLGSMIVLTLA